MNDEEKEFLTILSAAYKKLTREEKMWFLGYGAAVLATRTQNQ